MNRRLINRTLLLLAFGASAWGQIAFNARGAWQASTLYVVGDYFTTTAGATCAKSTTYFVAAAYTSGATCLTSSSGSNADLVELTYNAVGALPDEILSLSYPRLINNLYFVAQNMVTTAASPSPTGYWNFGNGSLRAPEKTVATLPAAAAASGKFYVVTDGQNAADCTSGGDSTAALCRSNGTAWVPLGGGSVISVAGRTGAVVLTRADVGLPNVDNTSDASKPVSTAQQAALNSKDTITPVSSLPAAASATIGRLYRWTGAATANTCPTGGASGSGGSAVAFCATLDGSTWMAIAGGASGLPYHDYGTVSGAVTLDAASYGFVQFTMSGAITVTVTGGDSKQPLVIRVCENGIGGYAVTWPGNVQETDAIDTGANNCTTQAFRYNGSTFLGSSPAKSNSATPGLVLPDGHVISVPTGANDTMALVGRNETVTGSKTYTGAVDASGASKTLPIQTGLASAIPSTCTVGQMYFATDGIAGRQLQKCASTNTWKPVAYSVDTTANITASACQVGQTAFATDATAGQNWYGCTATNTWTQIGGANSSTASPPLWYPTPGSQGYNGSTLFRFSNSAVNAGTRVSFFVPSPGVSSVYAYITIGTNDVGKYFSIAVYNSAMTSKLCETTPSAAPSAITSNQGARRLSWASTCSLSPGWYYLVTTSESSALAYSSAYPSNDFSQTYGNAGVASAGAWASTGCVSTGTGANLAFNSNLSSCTWNSTVNGLVPIVAFGN